MSLLILNGSPRAPRSNSKRYAEAFCRYWRGTVETENLLRGDVNAPVRQGRGGRPGFAGVSPVRRRFAHGAAVVFEGVGAVHGGEKAHGLCAHQLRIL